jgi:hypothetical protein
MNGVYGSGDWGSYQLEDRSRLMNWQYVSISTRYISGGKFINSSKKTFNSYNNSCGFYNTTLSSF